MRLPVAESVASERPSDRLEFSDPDGLGLELVLDDGEDEPLIALELERLVQGLGHRVVRIARTEQQAVEAVRLTRPGLVLADIQLADGSSGLDAVNEFLQGFSVPVIFVTAYPERLLTGTKPEPTFLVSKPFHPDALKAVISQALFFDMRSKA